MILPDSSENINICGKKNPLNLGRKGRLMELKVDFWEVVSIDL